MQWIKKAMLFAGIGICVIGSVPVKAQAQQTGTFLGRPLFDNQLGGMDIEDGGREDSLDKRGTVYATQYDPRVTGAVSQVEDQGMTNTCWAFATIAAIEGNLIKKGYETSAVDLSENNLAYFFYNRQTDPVGYTKGDYNSTGSKGLVSISWDQNGGLLQGTANYLATWAGVVKATTSEDDEKGCFKPVDLAGVNSYKVDYHVKNAYFFDYNIDMVKQAIMDYGAVASGIYMDEKYLSWDEEAYYCPKKEGNHAVAIVGWDDNYSRYNFTGSATPKRDGAWIVKNSYGKETHGDGYVYVSYEDASLCEITAYDMEPVSQSNDNNYQYDGTANPMYSAQQPSGTTYANVFKVKANANGCNEILKAVSAEVYTQGVSYELQIYTGVTSTSNPTKGKAMFAKPQKGTFKNAGYNRVELNTPVTLTPGEKYAVVFKFTTKNGVTANLAVDTYGAGYDYKGNKWISFTSDTQKGRGYIYYSKTWMDVGDESLDLRIKAYTDNTNEKTSYALSSKELGISKGSSSTLSLKISSPSVKRKVTWSSSNKKVATVSSSGKVQAKAYGTTTIKAKFVAGSNTKTLTCKVTIGPSKVKDFKVKAAKKKMTVSWKKNSDASGYVIYYSNTKTSGYKSLTTIKSNTNTKYTKKLKAGTYYVKMRPYVTKNGKKLYGSFTSVKKVTIK